jgi:hypothetical protein
METVDYATAVERLAPCGLDCARCLYFGEGKTQTYAEGLRRDLEGFEKVAPMLARRTAPVLQDYDKFSAILDLLAGGECVGCRKGAPCFESCVARTCFREKGVDFCFQCAEFPCDRNHYPESLDRRWRAYGARMREVGVERFYEESLRKPRYE